LTYAYLFLPLRAHGPQVVSKDRGRAAAIRAMNYRDVPVGKLYAFVHRGNAAIVPLFDLTQKDVHHDIRIEMDGLVDSGKIVGNYNCSHRRWDVVQLPLRIFDICVSHRRVRRAEVHSLLHYLTNATTRSYRLVIDANVRMKLVVFAHPLGIERVRKSCACSLEGHVLCVGGFAIAPTRRCVSITLARGQCEEN